MSALDQAAQAVLAECRRQAASGELAHPPGGQLDIDAGALVRVVMAALREPDERMKEAGAEVVRNVGPAESDEAYLSDAANTWRFMIDAVLQDL